MEIGRFFDWVVWILGAAWLGFMLWVLLFPRWGEPTARRRVTRLAVTRPVRASTVQRHRGHHRRRVPARASRAGDSAAIRAAGAAPVDDARSRGGGPRQARSHTGPVAQHMHRATRRVASVAQRRHVHSPRHRPR